MVVPPFTALTVLEQRHLLRLARDSIRAALEGEAEPACAQLSPALTVPTAAFVSLHREQRLRGCIGTLEAERPLHRTVARIAVSAAFEDPRFPPLQRDELPHIAVEISRLSRLVPAPPEAVCVGRHGVLIKVGDCRGVFLPQVATLFQWDRETLLTEVCRKAQLPPDAWRRADVELMIFEAEVFADEA